MENKKEIHEEIVASLEKLEEIYKSIDKAMAMAVADSFLQDTLHVAYRNLATTQMKLEVARDLTESL